MSDSEDSTVTYTAMSIPFKGLSDIGSPGVDGPPLMPEDLYAYVVAAFQAPPSLDYVSGLEHPPSPVYVSKFIPEPVYLEFTLAEDDILPVEEEPLPAAALPTTEGNEGDDEDESSDDDDDDDDIDIEGDEEEDEYLALADSTTFTLTAVDHAPSAEETDPFETDESAATPLPHPVYRVTARMSIRPQTPISLPSDTEISRLMAIPTSPPSPLSPLSSPLPHIPSPPLPLLSPPPTDLTYEEAPLGYRAAILRWRAEKGEIPEADLPLRKRLCTAHTGTYELGESSAVAAARLGEPIRDDLYKFVDTEKRDDQALQRARVNKLFSYRRYHARTARLIEGEARASHTAWAQSMDANDAARSRVIALRTQVSAQQTEITNLRAVDRRFQTKVRTQQEEIRELRAADRKLHALKSCQTQLTAALGHI
nr:hypothetical protein [Tanacetum cinerariifolium]